MMKKALLVLFLSTGTMLHAQTPIDSSRSTPSPYPIYVLSSCQIETINNVTGTKDSAWYAAGGRVWIERSFFYNKLANDLHDLKFYSMVFKPEDITDTVVARQFTLTKRDSDGDSEIEFNYVHYADVTTITFAKDGEVKKCGYFRERKYLRLAEKYFNEIIYIAQI